MFNPFSSKSKKKEQGKATLAELGLDPSLLDDPVVSDDEGEEEFGGFKVQEMPKFKPVDISGLIGEEDIHVELNEEGK